ncbi:MAG: endonuclease III [Blastocatellia bacterium]|nr:endonuclease III [Blastocatellia bacterium]MCS7158424.1 endonuclease III [Blastocatellia bacterium]MCX7752930.1 endonuclease III [Blastocatellia bacterium]MDW8167986.1 endonuclease III [Acidobacteriota bacterium]MDW8256361.1 endonuclease III [Acidobacteriota bacterium]
MAQAARARRRRGAGPAAVEPRSPSPEEQARAREILARLQEKYPVARTALHFRTPLELLVATILSAQCTDERVNRVTAELFQKYRTAADYAAAPLRELEHLIRPTGYYRNKARAIKAACQKIVADFGGEVPATMEALLTLPGVARKTANVVLQNAFGIPSGIVVDTHVLRVAQRLGLTRHTDRDKVERDLMALIPKGEWIAFSHRLIFHGRETCRARRPLCGQCVLQTLCPYPQKTK